MTVLVNIWFGRRILGHFTKDLLFKEVIIDEEIGWFRWQIFNKAMVWERLVEAAKYQKKILSKI